MFTSRKINVLSTLFTLLIGFWLNGASAGTLSHITESNTFKKAELMLSRSELDSAIELLGTKVDSFQRRDIKAKGHALLCNAHYQKQDFVIAEEHCDQAVILGDGNWSNLNNRGVMRFMLGRYEESLVDFKRALLPMLLAEKLLTGKSQKAAVKSNIESAQRRLAQVDSENPSADTNKVTTFISSNQT
jgi:tetratricopeptide (TPR) repeat protein